MMTLDRRALVSAMTWVGMAVLLPGAPVAAQARFPWAEERRGFMDKNYQIPGMCRSAFHRVDRDERNKIPLDSLWANPMLPESPLAVDTLKRCRQSPRATALTDKRDFEPMMIVLNAIGDSAAYFELLDRRIALYAGPYEQWEPVLRYPGSYVSRGWPHDEEMSASLPDVFPASDSSVKIMRAIGPLRLVYGAFAGQKRYAWREHILTRYRHLFGKERVIRNQMVQYDFLLDLSMKELQRTTGKVDEATWRARLAAVVAFADSMTAAKVLLTPDEWQMIRSKQLITTLLLDSIPVTNADIWPRQVANVYKTFAPNQPPENNLADLGTTAPPLNGTYWYRATGRGGDSAFTKVSSPSPVPAKGRWSLVVRVPRLCDGPYCANEFVAIRNFKQRYGEQLDVILVTSTAGSFLTMEPSTPEQESDAVARLLFGFYKLPGILSVTELKSMQLPAPDLRWRMTGEVENDGVGYTKPPVAPNGALLNSRPYGVLVDPQGRVMLRLDYGRSVSRLTYALLDVLIK